MVLQVPIVRWSDGTYREAPELLGLTTAKAIRSYGYAQVVLDNVTPVWPQIPEGATIALVRVEAQAIRYRDDGTDVTPTVGMPVAVGETLIYDAEMSDISVIGQQNGAVLNIIFYGPDNG